MNPFARLNAFMGGYEVQNWLFVAAIGVTVIGMVSGSVLVTYIGSSWTLGSLLSPFFRVHNQWAQMAIGIVGGAAFTWLIWAVKGWVLG